MNYRQSSWRYRSPLILFLISIIFILPAHLVEGAHLSSAGYFKGRITKINAEASLVRFKLDFHNMRFINKRDKIEFWPESVEAQKMATCYGTVVGRTNDYLLVRLANWDECTRSVNLALGNYLSMYSPDFANNLLVAKDLMEVLAKKRLATEGRLKRLENELQIHLDKVQVINDRYSILKSKLEAQWQEEIDKLNEDNKVNAEQLQMVRNELHAIDAKMEQYRVDDDNYQLDRWALDSKLYFRK